VASRQLGDRTGETEPLPFRTRWVRKPFGHSGPASRGKGCALQRLPSSALWNAEAVYGVWVANEYEECPVLTGDLYVRFAGMERPEPRQSPVRAAEEKTRIRQMDNGKKTMSLKTLDASVLITL